MQDWRQREGRDRLSTNFRKDCRNWLPDRLGFQFDPHWHIFHGPPDNHGEYCQSEGVDGKGDADDSFFIYNLFRGVIGTGRTDLDHTKDFTKWQFAI